MTNIINAIHYSN